MNSVCIGVHVHAEPAGLFATLAALQSYSPSTDVILLPDGPDPATSIALGGIRLPQLHNAQPMGSAACFNRLAVSTRSDLVILMESGSEPGPGWLERILAALESDPRNGLAGPSTNRSWNEQAAFPNASGTADAVARTAHLAAQKFGNEYRTLEPLHSLADFCYAVKREVVEKIGAADESYGLGPCWEMDYNIRAHRAGYRGVWACSSYVYRAPFTSRRMCEEARGFSFSKKHYQDKFCGLRLSGSRNDYETHCRGDACEHFAPPGLVQVHLPLAVAPAGQIDPIQVGSQQPLVSCIMVTGDRPDFVLQSVRYFQRQDYPHRELIIVDDGATDLTTQLADDDRIRYVKLPARSAIGTKRNHACQLARGDFIAHWDDDDWYSPQRLRVQIAPLLARHAEISAMRAGIFFDLPRWKFWQCTAGLHRRLFVEDVHGGTLAYTRECWNDFVRYPDISLAEDAAFLRCAMQRGRRLARLPNDGAFIYVRHQKNAWSFDCGRYLDPQGWSIAPAPDMPPADLRFYAEHSSNAPAEVRQGTNSNLSDELPMVSCIMPTADRRAFVPRAIGHFLRQDYANRELIIVDDGHDSAADLVPDNPAIHYLRLPSRQTVGAKRNIACEHSRGSIIAHWDDDDWFAPWRLSYQAGALSQVPVNAVCGLSNLYYFDPLQKRAWFYAYPDRQRRWLAGNTMCYHKETWRQHSFPNVNEGEDTRFVWSLKESSILPLPNHGFLVGIVHPGNTSPKRTGDIRWQPRPVSDVESLLGADFAIYDAPASANSQSSGCEYDCRLRI